MILHRFSQENDMRCSNLIDFGNILQKTQFMLFKIIISLKKQTVLYILCEFKKSKRHCFKALNIECISVTKCNR